MEGKHILQNSDLGPGKTSNRIDLVETLQIQNLFAKTDGESDPGKPKIFTKMESYGFHGFDGFHGFH